MDGWITKYYENSANVKSESKRQNNEKKKVIKKKTEKQMKNHVKKQKRKFKDSNYDSFKWKYLNWTQSPKRVEIKLHTHTHRFYTKMQI